MRRLSWQLESAWGTTCTLGFSNRLHHCQALGGRIEVQRLTCWIHRRQLLDGQRGLLKFQQPCTEGMDGLTVLLDRARLEL